VCGINGFNFKDDELITKMSSYTKSRGPDFTDYFKSVNYTVSHNRLAIIDPEERSNQPFKFKNLILSFNGEIYNFMELKEKLKIKGHNFLTNSDTEVIIKLFYEYKEESFKLLSGIFALSIYDCEKNKLYLIRDHVGVKPLYYYFDIKNNKFAYSSLIKPLLLVSGEKNINRDAINYYANFSRNDLRETFYKNIFKLLPGELIVFENNELKKKNFLNFNFKRKFKKKEFKNDIKDYFSKQFISDVPVALSLSGGIDSNLIFNELLEKKKNQFKCYSVFFKGSQKYTKDFNYARNLCEINDVNFQPVEVSIDSFIENFEKVVDIVEEPVANTNSISNMILSEKIEEKVLFSGDGGDEIFTGYDKYRSIYFFNLLNKLNILSNSGFTFKNKNLNRLFIKDSRDMFLSFSEQNLSKNQSLVYRNYQKVNSNDLDQVLNHSRFITKDTRLANVMLHEIDTWLQNDILLRNDKIYANSGIEVRVPFLDKNIIEKYLMINEFHKYGLFFKYKNLLRKYFSIETKYSMESKSGFNSPFASWLRVELFQFANEILDKNYYDSSNILNLKECKNLLKDHKDNYIDPFLIWNLISLQVFLKKNNF
tara:strand:+ start:4229 stop:6013 length:1785 start_codon:yes stop_codon:yes gene_type:complete